MARAGGEKRGNWLDRARSKVNILWRDGNGEYVRCTHCPKILTFETMERDRIIPGATYALHNVQASCSPCNKARSNNPTWSPNPIGATA